MKTKGTIPFRTIGRMIFYMRTLADMEAEGKKTVFSYELAAASRNTPAQVRRDIMAIRCAGTPHGGYKVELLLRKIREILGCGKERRAVLIGTGDLGRAVLKDFAGHHPDLRIAAVFGTDPAAAAEQQGEVPCLSMAELKPFVEKNRIAAGILAVPDEKAGEAAEQMVSAGIRGILNLTYAPLKLPPEVYCENIDLAGMLEKVAFFAERSSGQRS